MPSAARALEKKKIKKIDSRLHGNDKKTKELQQR